MLRSSRENGSSSGTAAASESLLAVAKDSVEQPPPRPTYGVEHHLFGLSPQFWAHTPMLIYDVLSLALINGVDCMVSPPQKPNERLETTCSDEPSFPQTAGKKRPRSYDDVSVPIIPIVEHVVPVSRCELCGIIVNVERKAYQTMYLLDDGTGLIDCVSWEDDSDGVYALPSLVNTFPRHNHGPSSFRVGDVVRIRGKIRCVSVGRETTSIDILSTSDQHLTTSSSKQRYEIPKKVVREITIATIENILPWKSSDGLNSEAVHMLKAIQLGQRIKIRCDDDCKEKSQPISTAPAPSCILDEDHNRRCKEFLEPIPNGADVLKKLGSDIERRVQTDGDNFIDDESGSWRLFGPDCSCDLVHKDKLLYCHCLATPEPLDPRQLFRDTLLKHLVDIQSNNATTQIRFQYGEMLRNEDLFAKATEIVGGTSNPTANARRLFINTFRALRDDGIIYLDDQARDIYLLISSSSVLEPWAMQLLNKDASALERSLRKLNPPPYLRRVPANRLRFVMKRLASLKRESRGKT